MRGPAAAALQFELPGRASRRRLLPLLQAGVSNRAYDNIPFPAGSQLLHQWSLPRDYLELNVEGAAHQGALMPRKPPAAPAAQARGVS